MEKASWYSVMTFTSGIETLSHFEYPAFEKIIPTGMTTIPAKTRSMAGANAGHCIAMS
ncbi:hypothetical protein VQ042_15415 [Aurantimonas sp. A2-1-M11]|uniref:hypothetical protein n=1 Tax=Aurantimonas sp. A2-1-M11 TaxID=3113712 RepID=UPI002F947771